MKLLRWSGWVKNSHMQIPSWIIHPQKEDPNRIQITAGGNLIDCKHKVYVKTADINTAKLHWNSVISTEDAQ